MAGFCKKCGVQLRDGAGFCIACGTKVEELPEPEQQSESPPSPGPEYQAPSAYQAPPPVPGYQAPSLPPGPEYQTPPQGYGQPAQPVYKQPQAPAYGAPPKKKGLSKPLLIIIIVAAAFVALILILQLAAGGVISSQADKDFFKLGADQVPSVKLILGEKREVSSVSSSISNGVQEMVIGYKVDENQNKEMEKYTKALMDKYGYINTSSYNFTGSTGSGFQFTKESEEEGYIVIVQVDYDAKGYTLTLTRGKGALTINEEPEPVEPEPAEPELSEPEEPALPAADMVDLIIDSRLVDFDSEAEAIARLKKDGIEAFNNHDGSYTLRMTKEKQQEQKEKNKKSTTDFLEKLKEDAVIPGLLDVEYTQDFSNIKIISNDTLVYGEDNEMMEIVIMYCCLFGPLYQVYDGKGLDAKTSIVLYNADKGKTLDEFVSPDILSYH